MKLLIPWRRRERILGGSVNRIRASRSRSRSRSLGPICRISGVASKAVPYKKEPWLLRENRKIIRTSYLIWGRAGGNLLLTQHFSCLFSPCLAFLLSSSLHHSILILVSSIKMPTCRWPGNLTVTDGVPCGPTNSTFPVVPCCNARDQCMTDNICHYTRSRAGGSGYYIAGCSASEAGGFTDPSPSLSSICVNRCGMLSHFLIRTDQLMFCSRSTLSRCYIYPGDRTME